MPESPKTKSMTIPPPVLGWNTKDPISQMDPLYSPGIENYFPGNGTVSLRNGFTQHVATTSSSRIFHHICELVNNAGTHYLIAITSRRVYNVTTSGAGTDISGADEFLAFEYYTVNFRGVLFIKGNDTNDIYYTDGSTTTLAAFTGPSGDDKDLWRLTAYKGRLYALQRSDASMWYGAIDAITGAMTQFDFQSLLTKGGKPWYIGPFSMTAGDVTQEYFIVISEQGEVLLYQGDSPDDTTWALVGHYFIAAPVDRESFFNWGSDVLIVTYQGLLSMREVVGAGGSEYSFLSDNISDEFKTEILSSSVNITGIVYPKGQYLLVSIYHGEDSAVQLVMNTQTRAWTKFTGQRGRYWSLYNNDLYFCGEYTTASVSSGGYVGKADNGYFDQDPDNSAAILSRTTKLQFAYNYLDNPQTVKIPTEIRPIMYESEGLSITADVNVDYEDRTATSTVTDTTDTSYKFYKPVCGTTAMPGKAISVRFDGSVTTKRRSIQAVEVFWKEGDIR